MSLREEKRIYEVVQAVVSANIQYIWDPRKILTNDEYYELLKARRLNKKQKIKHLNRKSSVLDVKITDLFTDNLKDLFIKAINHWIKNKDPFKEEMAEYEEHFLSIMREKR